MIRFSPSAAKNLMIATLTLVPLIVAHGPSFRSDLPAPVLTQVSAGVSAGLA